ncbi:hypothetical protein [Atopobacter phocae]|uniref:hypothetical protein n=1 Tax=Atopobacter phocae TaxID=136492 RepID=UPI0004723764|nr:hypothetical protein [Atopobacter phocae]
MEQTTIQRINFIINQLDQRQTLDPSDALVYYSELFDWYYSMFDWSWVSAFPNEQASDVAHIEKILHEFPKNDHTLPHINPVDHTNYKGFLHPCT